MIAQVLDNIPNEKGLRFGALFNNALPDRATLICSVLVLTQIVTGFFAYPLVPFIVVGVYLELPFEVTIPQTLLSTALALPFVFLFPLRAAERWLIGVFAMLVGVSGWLGSSTIGNCFVVLGMISTPLVLAECFRRLRNAQGGDQVVTLGLSAVWFLNVIAVIVWGITSGLCGNPNWLAPVLVATAPFVVNLLSVSKGSPNTGGMIRLYIMLVVAGLTILALVFARCRASAIALAVYGVYLAIRKLPWRYSTMIVIGCATAGFGLVVARHDWFMQKYYNDVRGPMWHSTVRMIVSHPWLGFGPGNFQRDNVEFKTLEFERRLQIGAVFEHPHNELLHLMATIGVPAALVWLALLTSRLFNRTSSATDELARFAVVTMFVHGCFDKSLYVATSSVIFPIVLGLVLSFGGKPTGTAFTTKYWLAALPIAFISLFVGVRDTYAMLSCSSRFRECQMIYRKARSSMDEVQSKKWTRQAYELATQSCKQCPRTPLYPFVAGMIAAEELSDQDAAGELFNQVKSIESDYAYTDYMLARISLRAAVHDRDNPEVRKKKALHAVECIQRELEDHPFSSRIREDLTLAYWLAQQPDRAIESEAQTQLCYRTRFDMDCKADGVTPESRMAEWRESYLGSHHTRLYAAKIMTDAEQLNQLPNMSWLFSTGDIDLVAKTYGTATQFNEIDSRVWTGWRFLETGLVSVASIEDLSKALGQVWLDERPADSFRWPWEVWRIRLGSPLEIASLLAAICEIHKEPAAIFQGGNKVAVVFRWKNSWYIVDAAKASSLRRLTSQGQDAIHDIQTLCGLTPAAKAELRVFVLPSACCQRNLALWGALTKDNELSIYPRSPAVVISEFAAARPDLAAFGLAVHKEPFKRLVTDVLEFE